MKINGNNGINSTVVVKTSEGRLSIIKNTMTDVYMNLLRDLMKGDATNAEIGWLAWGDSDTATDSAHTQLGNEFGRKPVTKKQLGAGVGVLETLTFIAAHEAVGQIEELGWFAGPDATEDPNSGIMIARALYSQNKTELITIQVDRTDTFEEVV